MRTALGEVEPGKHLEKLLAGPRGALALRRDPFVQRGDQPRDLIAPHRRRARRAQELLETIGQRQYVGRGRSRRDLEKRPHSVSETLRERFDLRGRMLERQADDPLAAGRGGDA